MTYDVLQRRLEDLGHEVRMVRNITDVDEPIYAKAIELGISYTELASNEATRFRKVLEALNFRPTYAEPKASEYITQMANAVQRLLEQGFAYRLHDDVYFDISRFPAYATFSGFSERLLLGLAISRGGDPQRTGKRQPLDFLLWKGITDVADPAQWETVVGVGRPGWHIECSVMAAAQLAVPFDLHGGGSDLIFPHHSSEVAQSFGLDQVQLAKTWVHVAPLLHDGEKMSKSLGNLVFAADVLEQHEPSVLRLALMHYHHRIGGEWQDELLWEATRLLEDVRAATKQATNEQTEALLEAVRLAIDDDINTLDIVDCLHDFVLQTRAQTTKSEANNESIKRMEYLLGISL
jgi:L-cysteine:1D-myo-inositol 2-amino-2-deoxy-alpha-D-glucopyranoside ligase